MKCEIRDSSWFPEDLIQKAAPVVVNICLTRKNDNRIEVKGSLRTTVELECDRCLKRYAFSVDSPMQLVVEVAEENEHWRLQNIDSAGVDLETISQVERVVDLGELLRQQLFLALPEKNICMEKCSGLCPNCGAELNKENCSCSREVGSSPFAVLGTLKKR